MASSSKDGSKSSRIQSRSAVVRHRPKKPSDDGTTERKKPDVEELRRIRAAYFGRPHAERSRVIRPKTSTVTTTSISKRSRTASSIKQKGTTRETPSASIRSSRSRTSSSKSKDRTAEYVYNTEVPDAPPPDEQTSLHTERSIKDKPERRQRTHRAKHASSSNISRASAVAETDLTPDDSISVVAERQYSRSDSVSAKSRPSVKRSSTASSRLPSVAEESTRHRDSESSGALKKSSKRDSGLLRGLLRRNTTTAAPKPVRLVECLTCGSDDIPHAQSAKLSCGHRMCHTCLQRVFELSVKDPAHMPPRCCDDEHIPLKHVDTLFDVKFKMLWNRKYQEFHCKNRIYCPNPKCGDWIKPAHFHTSQGRQYAQCSRCKLKVCTSCNNKMHRSRDCPEDLETMRLVEQAKEKGWQRCFNCNSMVELKEGCNHMTCRCLAEFCMICGSRWKTCECPWFNYSSLPSPDALNHMRVPEQYQVMYRRVYNAATGGPAPPQAQPRVPQQANHGEITYQQEMDRRRRQEALDADLARRLQLASIMDSTDEPPVRRQGQMETWGLGNAAGHFLNDNFVNNAADVVMSAFGDINFGRRGERASGRRRRAREPDQSAGSGGLVPNFLGDQSVLGIGPATRPG